VPKELGPNREYNIDLVPKFMMSNGLLVKVLLHTDVVKYLEFKAVDGSFVLNKGKIHKAGGRRMGARMGAWAHGRTM
jgi:Rab GDP dissociation inhibitor